MVPRSNSNSKPVDVDVYASQTLANAKTAQEYVNKAIEMKTKYDHTTPSSSFVKYDIYEADKTKLMPVISTPSHVTEPMLPLSPIAPKEDISDMTKSASEYTDFSIEHPQDHRPYLAQTITTTYKHPALTNHYKNIKDSESSNSDHYNQHNYNHNNQYLQNFDAYDSIRQISHDNRQTIDDAMRKFTGYPSKEELIKYIERAVKKYLKDYDLSNRLTSSPLSGSSSAQDEFKTYYHYPSSTAASPIEPTKLYSAGIHSEFFKPSKGSYSTSAYGTVKPFAVDSYVPEGVDLTIPSKKRPKPIDLSALDVGQSWSHSSTSHGEPVLTYRKKKKPKIHLSSQTYQDINALPYAPNRGLIYDEYSPSSPATYIDHSSGSGSGGSYYLPHKDHSVGASISFGDHSHGSKSHKHKHKHHHSHHHDHHHDDSKSHFVPSMQVVNGIPITNPYHFNMEQLK